MEANSGGIAAAYAGTRVVELASGFSAGVAGRFFADLGADVVRAEAFEPMPSEAGERALLAWSRARKRTMLTPEGHQLGIGDVAALLAGADVLITDLNPGRWAASFPPVEALADEYPGVVIVDLTRFGRAGPYTDFLAGDLVMLALSGYLFVCGLNVREPLRLGVDLVDIVTGVNAAGGAMAGLHYARRTGRGQVVEVSALRTMLGMAMSFPTSYSFQGTVRRRSATPMVGIGAMVPCKDGHALVTNFRTPSEVLFALLDDERLLEERFTNYLGREVHQQEMVDVIAEAAASRTKRELFEGGQGLRLQNAMVQSPLELPSDLQHVARHFFQPLALENSKTIPAPMSPVVPPGARGEHVHRNGEMVPPADAVWQSEPVARSWAAAPGKSALEGLKVLELTFAWAGPFMGRILGDHGAQVVKVESRKYPDTARGVDLVDCSFGDNGRWLDRSLSYIIANPGKYHLGMELTNPASREVLLDLVRWADVVIENFTPRVLPNLGLGWDLFRSVNPSLIMVSATGFGQQGPYRDYGAFGWTLECQSGVTYTTGYLGESDPALFIPTISDPLAATVGVTAILAALEERRRSGKGQWLDLSQHESTSFATLVDILRAGTAGGNRPRAGNRHAWKAPQGLYRCSGDDEWVAVAVETDAQWERLCGVLGRRDFAEDEGLRTHSARYAQHGRIDKAIAVWAQDRTKYEAMQALQQAGVPAGAVQHSKDLHHDPQVKAMDYFRAAWGTEIGLRVWPGTWYGMQATPGDIRRGTSTFGEDNERVLRDILNYGPEKLKDLLSSGAFSDVADGLEKPAAPGLPVATMLERGMILSWDDDYRLLPAEVAERNQRWRHRHGLPDANIHGRDD